MNTTNKIIPIGTIVRGKPEDSDVGGQMGVVIRSEESERDGNVITVDHGWGQQRNFADAYEVVKVQELTPFHKCRRAERAAANVAGRFAYTDTLVHAEDGRISVGVRIYRMDEPISPEREEALLKACRAEGIADCECVRNPEGDVICYGFMD